MDIPVIKWHRYQWVHFTSLSEAEVQWLKQDFDFHDLDLEDSVAQKTLRPKWEVQQKHSFFIFHFAHLDKRGRLEIQELKVFVGKNFLITIAAENMPVSMWFSQAQVAANGSALVNGTPATVLYHIVDRLVDQGLQSAHRLGSMLDNLDQRMTTLDKSSIEGISVMRRNLIIYATTMKPMIQIFSHLEATQVVYLNGKLRDYWGNVGDHLQQITDLLADYSELLDGLTESFDVLLTQKTNQRIRVLTVFSVLMLPLTLLSGIYGMNIHLPFAERTDAFWLILFGMGSLLIVMIGFFRWKDWI